ncbi:50S ribosomal protein L11 methyltransferase [candidate division KSB1 bacterium]|nr:MAG: 50S ribosomal protein L11 methyltransferase [candidate division KSB1 bacterium]
MANNAEPQWIEVRVQVLPLYLETLSAFIFATRAQGIQEEENGFSVFYDARDWSPEIYQMLLKELQRIVPDFDDSRLHVQTQQNEDWLHNWKQNFKPFHLTDTLVIQPDWENYQAKPGETVLTIAPKMAFGTGHHESTQLCLFLMDELLESDMTVLDVGTGSGILSIYAKKQGAGKVLGIDNDPFAIENAYENLALNAISEGVEFRVADAHEFRSEHFDLVVANIIHNILLKIASGLAAATRPGGRLILSGILASERQLMTDTIEKLGFELITEKTKNEWIGLAFKKKAGTDE